MAFSEFYCNASTGSNINGGSDENASPSYSATNGGWNSGTGVFTPTSGDPSASVTVGQFAHVFADGATTPTFIGRVTAVNSTTVTVSTTAKSGTAPGTAASGISINVGGVWKGPNGTVGFPFGFITSALVDASSNRGRVNFKNGTTYSITSAITHANANVNFQGYTTSAGDGGMAVLDGGTTGASYVPLTISGAQCQITDFIVQNNGDSGTSAGLVFSGGRLVANRVVVNNVRGNGLHFSSSSGGIAIECEAFACNQSNTSNLGGFLLTETTAIRCISHDNAGSNTSGFVCNPSAALISCVADTNGGRGVWIPNAATVAILGCVFHGNGTSGIDSDSTIGLVIQNCIFVSNSTYGVTTTSASAGSSTIIVNCAFYSNTSGQTNNVNASLITGSITLTGDPFVDAANGDFDLNNTAGAGAACRNAGRGSFTQTAASYTGTASTPSVGASEPTPSGGGGLLKVGGQQGGFHRT